MISDYHRSIEVLQGLGRSPWLPKLDGLLPLSHPVVCGQRLYVRHDQQLYVYDVKAP